MTTATTVGLAAATIAAPTLAPVTGPMLSARLAPPPAAPPAPPQARVETTNAGLLPLVNQVRAGEGRAPLTAHPALAAAALAHARDMETNGFYAHLGSDGSTVGARTRAQGCSWTRLSQTIAQGPSEPGSVVFGWIDGQGSRDNLLADYTQFGEARVGASWVAVYGAGC